MKKWIALPALVAGALMLSSCGSSSSSSSSNPADSGTATGLPEKLHLNLVNATSGAYYSYDTSTGKRVNLNELAAASEESAVQKLQLKDTSVLGHFFHWADFRVVNGVEKKDMKYVLMRPTYTPGNTIDSDQFIQLAHFHGETLAAHSADEFANPEAGSNKEAGLQRLNSAVTAQKELKEELSEVMPAGETLCRAFIDPYIQFEQAQKTAAAAEAEHAHGELMHFALSNTGRVYFFKEKDEKLQQAQGFVKLDDVVTIENCSRTTIARASDDGVLVFIPDTQKLYLVDAHGGDYHQHSTWSLSTLLPAGERADMVAIIGAGATHEHE